jgi:hypothetical protein
MTQMIERVRDAGQITRFVVNDCYHLSFRRRASQASRAGRRIIAAFRVSRQRQSVHAIPDLPALVDLL